MPILLVAGGAYLLFSGHLSGPGGPLAFLTTPRPQMAPHPAATGSGVLTAFLPAIAEGAGRVGASVADWLRGAMAASPAAVIGNVPVPPATGETAAGAPAISTIAQPAETVPWWAEPVWGEPATSTADVPVSEEFFS